ncbi:hypothetical protein F0562_001839 [Nyssa sinensis]|uniref:Uncharacterized protein n=1 Tax=Nyssa sinensis TaxID=561372 RepID=A0A5J5C4A9_9ASTE|nr:hypothetical protein F0562_001839 [Nyssa sinensis]
MSRWQMTIDLIVGHARGELEAARAELEASRAAVQEQECPTPKALKQELKEAEVAAAQRLESCVAEAHAAAKAKAEKELLDEVNQMGHEFVDTRYLLFRKRIQKLYPDLGILGVEDVEVEDSNSTSPEPAPVQPAEGTVVEDAVPISAIPSVTLD